MEIIQDDKTTGTVFRGHTLQQIQELLTGIRIRFIVTAACRFRTTHATRKRSLKTTLQALHKDARIPVLHFQTHIDNGLLNCPSQIRDQSGLPVPGPRDDGRHTTRHHRLERRTQAGTVQYHPLPRNAQFRMKISAQASVPPSKRSGPWILIPVPHTPIGDQSLVCYSIIHNDTPINPTIELLSILQPPCHHGYCPARLSLFLIGILAKGPFHSQATTLLQVLRRRLCVRVPRLHPEEVRLIPAAVYRQDEAADLGIPGHFPQLNLSSKPPHQLHAVHLNLLLSSVDLCRAVDLARVKTMVAKRQKTGYRT